MTKEDEAHRVSFRAIFHLSSPPLFILELFVRWEKNSSSEHLIIKSFYFIYHLNHIIIKSVGFNKSTKGSCSLTCCEFLTLERETCGAFISKGAGLFPDDHKLSANEGTISSEGRQKSDGRWDFWREDSAVIGLIFWKGISCARQAKKYTLPSLYNREITSFNEIGKTC